jgi:hypothetical protein
LESNSSDDLTDLKTDRKEFQNDGGRIISLSISAAAITKAGGGSVFGVTAARQHFLQF